MEKLATEVDNPLVDCCDIEEPVDEPATLLGAEITAAEESVGSLAAAESVGGSRATGEPVGEPLTAPTAVSVVLEITVVAIVAQPFTNLLY